MSRLTTETGGLMLDLSYQDIREAVEKAAQIERVSYQKIGQITREAIDHERQLAEQQKTLLAEGQRSRIAILPHMPLDKLSFDPRSSQFRCRQNSASPFSLDSRRGSEKPIGG